MHDLSDIKLSERIRAGREKALWEIYDRYHVQMYHIAKKYVKDSNLANEAVQDIFVKLWEKKDRIDETKPIKEFLFTMLRNHVLNMIRYRKKEIISIPDVDREQLFRQNMTEDRMVYKECHDIVKQGMQERSRRKREVFEL